MSNTRTDLLCLSFAVVITVSLACRTDPMDEVSLPDGFNEEIGAETVGISVTGAEKAYTFNVEVKSPDLGCTQYADWWEVISPDSVLLYRRILAHSHVNEQPFKRAGGPIKISGNQVVIIRAHMNNLGYGVSGLRGSVQDGFSKDTFPSSFANHLAQQQPLPGDCPN